MTRRIVLDCTREELARMFEADSALATGTKSGYENGEVIYPHEIVVTPEMAELKSFDFMDGLPNHNISVWLGCNKCSVEKLAAMRYSRLMVWGHKRIEHVVSILDDDVASGLILLEKLPTAVEDAFGRFPGRKSENYLALVPVVPLGQERLVEFVKKYKYGEHSMRLDLNLDELVQNQGASSEPYWMTTVIRNDKVSPMDLSTSLNLVEVLFASMFGDKPDMSLAANASRFAVDGSPVVLDKSGYGAWFFERYQHGHYPFMFEKPVYDHARYDFALRKLKAEDKGVHHPQLLGKRI